MSDCAILDCVTHVTTLLVLYSQCKRIYDYRLMLRIVFSLLHIKYIFFGSRSVGLEGYIEYTKKGIRSAMECADIAGSLLLPKEIRLRFLCKFVSAAATVINLFALL